MEMIMAFNSYWLWKGRCFSSRKKWEKLHCDELWKHFTPSAQIGMQQHFCFALFCAAEGFLGLDTPRQDQGPGSSSTWRGLLQLREPPYLDLTFSLALNCHIGFYRWHLQAPDLYHILQLNLCANFRLWILTHWGASKSLALSELRSSFKGIILHPTESSRWVTGNLMSTEWIRITTWPPLRISLWVRDDGAYRNTRETLLKRPADPHMPGIPAVLSGTEALNIYWERLQFNKGFKATIWKV